MSLLIMVYVTMPSIEKAQEIALQLIEKKLIACATFFPCNSVYPWKGEVAHGQEVIMLVKTLDAIFEEFQHELEALHPYELPCILKVESVVPNDAYHQWALEQLVG